MTDDTARYGEPYELNGEWFWDEHDAGSPFRHGPFETLAKAHWDRHECVTLDLSGCGSARVTATSGCGR